MFSSLIWLYICRNSREEKRDLYIDFRKYYYKSHWVLLQEQYLYWWDPLSSGALLMTQSKYIRDLLQRKNILEAKPIYCRILLFTGLLLDPCSMWLSLILNSVLLLTRFANSWPHLSNPTVNKVCQFMASPYLKGALYSGLILCPASPHQHLSIRGFCDSDWASHPDDRKSTSGAAVYVGPNLVS